LDAWRKRKEKKKKREERPSRIAEPICRSAIWKESPGPAVRGTVVVGSGKEIRGERRSGAPSKRKTGETTRGGGKEERGEERDYAERGKLKGYPYFERLLKIHPT